MAQRWSWPIYTGTDVLDMLTRFYGSRPRVYLRMGFNRGSINVALLQTTVRDGGSDHSQIDFL